MVTICTKKFGQPTLQDRLLSKFKKKEEDKELEEFFEKLKKDREKRNSRVLSGTLIPNSTFKKIHTNLSSDTNPKTAISLTTNKSPVISQRSLKQDSQGSEIISIGSLKNRDDVLSGTSTLDELKELRDLLHKSSYIPKQISTRRPTIEKIKIAIEKEKQNLLDKNESTINDSIEFSNASTSTEKLRNKRKKKKSKTSTTNNSLGSSRRTSTQLQLVGVENRKKGTKKGKGKATSLKKIDVEIQCSIFKIKQ